MPLELNRSQPERIISLQCLPFLLYSPNLLYLDWIHSQADSLPGRQDGADCQKVAYSGHLTREPHFLSIEPPSGTPLGSSQCSVVVGF